MDKFKNLFRADLRSLAAFRISTGVILCLDLIYRLIWVKAHYTDWGILPRKFLVSGGLNEFRFSFHLFNGRVEFQIFLIIIAFLASFCFAIGYKTKVSGFISWILLLSIHNRAQPLLNSGDAITKMMLFWSLFLPLSKVYSIDAALLKVKKKISDFTYFSVANVFFFLQLCMMYWFSVVTKRTPPWMETQLAVYYALHIDQFAKPLGIWVRQFVGLTKFFTVYTLFIEIFGPLLALTPFKWGWFRFLGAALMINLHFGLYLTMEIGFFPWICIASWIAFFPSCFWEFFQKLLDKRLQSEGHIYFDRDCSFCFKLVHILKVFLILPNFKVSHAQDSEETNQLMESSNSWIIRTKENKDLLRFDAFIYLLDSSPIFFLFAKIAKLVPIHFIGTHCYKVVANNRNAFSFATKYFNETKEFKEPSKKVKVLLSIIFCYIIVYIGHTLNIGYKLPREVQGIGKTFSFTQKWTMFANPRRNDGWFVIKGILKNGKEVNVWTEEFGKVSFEKPKNVAKQYINQRWRKYLGKLNKKGQKNRRKYFSRYLCRRWNEKYKGDQKLDTFYIYFVKERTLDPGNEFKQKTRRLKTQYCLGKKKSNNSKTKLKKPKRKSVLEGYL